MILNLFLMVSVLRYDIYVIDYLRNTFASMSYKKELDKNEVTKELHQDVIALSLQN
ncbi:hypothetical protein P3TCK_04721 [Photobacterium profundum 3TCK]|uniref:Uncharacterized protein n=1 Tax=Photobacterium profundum 3TCK TaxID=314280 RepID=Q1ZA41_9GAMM|nr:hypothetical protein P3TCK_04721 [Photobacterium profundum 3TCK]